ncbi:MAG TPA: hypothetical protein VJP77_09385 [Planctomycetota bacterium]|nr:hypothetical protein [Planctomycetota bacterium]
MEFLVDLWLPILVSAVLVFVASSVIHMLVQWHKQDYAPLPGEDAVADALRAAGAGPGNYMFPRCESMKQLQDPAVAARFERGPIGILTLLPPGPPAMGKALGQWFAFCLFVGVFTAYVASLALGPGAEYLKVFQLVGATAFLGYAVSEVTESIWKGVAWSTTAKYLFDGLIYAVVTAGTFGWLWPAA